MWFLRCYVGYVFLDGVHVLLRGTLKKATEALRPDIPAAWIDAGVYDLQAALGNSKGVLST